MKDKPVYVDYQRGSIPPAEETQYSLTFMGSNCADVPLSFLNHTHLPCIDAGMICMPWVSAEFQEEIY